MLRALCWHLGVFKRVSKPSQCAVTHKLSKNSRIFFLGGLYILYPQYHSILVEEGEYGEIFLVSALKKRIF